MTLPKEQRRQLERMKRDLERRIEECARGTHEYGFRFTATNELIEIVCERCGRTWEVTER